MCRNSNFVLFWGVQFNQDTLVKLQKISVLPKGLLAQTVENSELFQGVLYLVQIFALKMLAASKVMGEEGNCNYQTRTKILSLIRVSSARLHSAKIWSVSAFRYQFWSQLLRIIHISRRSFWSFLIELPGSSSSSNLKKRRKIIKY